MSDLDEVINDQIERQAVSAISVKDGHVFTFPAEVLEELLARAIESGTGRVQVFVKHGARS